MPEEAPLERENLALERSINIGLSGAVILAAFAVASTLFPLWALLTAVLLMGLAIFASADDELSIPRYGLFLIVALIPLAGLAHLGKAMDIVGGGRFTLRQIIGVGSLLYLVGVKVMYRRNFVQTAQTTWIAIFAAVVIISFALNQRTGYTGSIFRQYITAFLLVFLTVNVVEKERDVATILGILVVGHFVSALMGFAGFAYSVEHEAFLPGDVMVVGQQSDAGRFQGVGGASPVAFGMALLTMMAICSYFLISTRRQWVRLFGFPILLVLSYAMVITYARTAYLAFILGAVMLLGRFRKRISPIALIIAMAIGVLAVSQFVDADKVTERIAEIGANPATDKAMMNRIGYMRIGFRLLSDNPLLGIGPGNFSEMVSATQFRYFLPTHQEIGRHLHNMYAAVACDVGLLGMTAFILILGTVFRDLRFVRRSYGEDEDSLLKNAAGALEIAFTLMLFMSFFNPTQYSKLVWLMIALSAAIGRIRRKQLAEMPGEDSAVRA